MSSDPLAAWSSERDRDHLLVCLAYLYACVCALFLAAQILLGERLAALAWTPLRAAKSFGALALLLAQHRRIALSLLRPIGQPAEPPSAWLALRSAASRELLSRARLAPAMLLAAAVVVRELLLLSAPPSAAAADPAAPAAWVSACTPAAGGPPCTCYAPELALAAAWALLCAAGALAGYGEEQSGLRWPLLQQDLFLTLRPRALPALANGCRACARAAALLFAAVALAPAFFLSPPVRLLHALRIRHAPAAHLALPPAGGRLLALASREHWLRLWLGGCVFAAGWHAALLLVRAAYTRRLRLPRELAPAFRAQPAAAPAGAAQPLPQAPGQPPAPLTQRLSLLDLSLLARFEPRRRAELFAAQSGAAFQAAVAECVDALVGLRERARALGEYSARGGAGAPPLPLPAHGALRRRWQRAVHAQLCCEALSGAESACWAAHALAALLSASRAEDRLGTAQSRHLVRAALDAILTTLAALEQPALGALLPAARGAARASAPQQRGGANTPQQRRMAALLPARKVRRLAARAPTRRAPASALRSRKAGPCQLPPNLLRARAADDARLRAAGVRARARDARAALGGAPDRGVLLAARQPGRRVDRGQAAAEAAHCRHRLIQ